MRDSTVFKRFETDREYRARLLAHPRVRGLVADQAKVYCNVALDAIGDLVDVQRRIIEVFIEPRARQGVG
jgi:hypothetical protein